MTFEEFQKWYGRDTSAAAAVDDDEDDQGYEEEEEEAAGARVALSLDDVRRCLVRDIWIQKKKIRKEARPTLRSALHRLGQPAECG